MSDNMNRYRRNYQYNNSSSAYDYAHKRFTETNDFSTAVIRKRTTERRIKEQKRKEALRKQKLEMIKTRQEVKKDRINHILCYVLAGYIVVMGVFVLKIMDNNNLVQKEILAKQETIKQQEKDISDAKIMLTENVDIHAIEEKARTELHMSEPTTDQIVYVTLPQNNSYIEYDGTGKK